MGVTNFPNGVRVGSEAGGTAEFILGSTTVLTTPAELNILSGVTATAAEINAIAGGGLSATELGYLDTAIAGTAVASKALIAGATKNIDTLDIAASGLKIAGTAISADAGELNKLDGVTATTAEINTLAGAIGAVSLGFDSATPYVMAAGSTAITGTTGGTIATGLGGAPSFVVASLADSLAPGTAAQPGIVYARPHTAGGSIFLECYDLGGVLASQAGTVHWIALGTAAS